MRTNKATLKLSTEELYEIYGVELNEDGTVFDTIERKKFKTLAAWMQHAEEQEREDQYGSFEKTGGRYSYDDEY